MTRARAFALLALFALLCAPVLVAQAWTPEDHSGAEINDGFAGGAVGGDIDLNGNSLKDTSTGTIMSFPADGDVKITDATGTAGGRLTSCGADAIGLETLAGADGATFCLGADGYLRFGHDDRRCYENGSGIRCDVGTLFLVQQDTDNAVASSGILTINSGASDELTASTGVQYGTSITPEFAGSGTMAGHVLILDAEDTSTGSGQDHIIHASWGGVEKLAVQDDGDTTITGGTFQVILSGATIGWASASAGNTACTTTCAGTGGCVIGFDSGGSTFVDCDAATADTCLCSGPAS